MRIWLAVVLTALAAACSRVDDAPPVATPTVVLSQRDVAIGSPIEMTYRFAVASNAPAFADDYWVFVHFIDSNGELMWTDDHQPPTPTRQWKAGSTIEYERTMFVPKFPYVGETRVEVGLFSPATNERLPLAGETEGQRAYRVATFKMRLQTDNLFVIFRDGWYDAEVGGAGSGREWQWSRTQATFAFRNPRRDVRFYLEADQPGAAAFGDPQRVELRIGDTVVDAFPVPTSGASLIRRVDIRADRLGAGETVEMTLSVDKTFVPAEVPELKSSDPRELGLRVFRAFVQPI
ncbi:MAG: hypothetical protein HYU37_10130 [Acidobacteria bacterium]|nr:hypothetical protein [Acidobacteriota bacterium]